MPAECVRNWPRDIRTPKVITGCIGYICPLIFAKLQLWFEGADDYCVVEVPFLRQRNDPSLLFQRPNS